MQKEKKKMMSRSDAVAVLDEIAESGVLREDLQDAVEEIEMILRHEDEDDLSFWDADDEEIHDLFVAKRVDLITDAWKKHCKELSEKYRMKK